MVISKEINESERQNQLVVATNAEFAPFEYTVGQYYYGIDLEIAYELALKLNKQLVIVNMDFDAVLTSVQSGYCDIAMAGLTINSTRELIVNFTESYYAASQKIIVKNDNMNFKDCITADDVVAKLLSLGSIKIGGQTGNTAYYYVTGDEDWGFEGISNATWQGYTSAAQAVTDMLNGNIDIVMVDAAPAAILVKSFNR